MVTRQLGLFLSLNQFLGHFRRPDRLHRHDAKGSILWNLSAPSEKWLQNGDPEPKMRNYENRSEMKSIKTLEVLSCLGSKESIFREKIFFRHFRLKICYLTATAAIGGKQLSQQYKIVRKYAPQKCPKFTEFFFFEKTKLDLRHISK